MTSIRFWIVLLGATLLAGCSATGPVYQTAPAPDEGNVLVYLYRPSRFAMGGQDAHFSVNDVNIASLSTGGYTWFQAPAGDYVLRQTWRDLFSRQLALPEIAQCKLQPAVDGRRPGRLLPEPKPAQ
jgi:hypothetical protein